MQNINGKIAVVTGGSEGIGKGIAKALLQAGAKVAVIARSSDKLASAKAELGEHLHTFAYDLSDMQQLHAALLAVETELGAVDILINNVGAGTFKPMQQQSAAEAALPIALPLGAAVNACQYLIPKMLERQSGHIVNLTSPAGFVPFPYMMPYAAARHGIVGLSYSLYYELKQHNIGVTLFCPSEVKTGYFDHNDADMGWYPKGSKLFPVLSPDEVGTEVVKAIIANKRVAIYPLILRLFVNMYQKMPVATIAMMNLLGLWQPSAKQK